MTPTVKAAVEKAAAADYRTLASLIEKLLIEYLKANGFLKKVRFNGLSSVCLFALSLQRKGDGQMDDQKRANLRETQQILAELNEETELIAAEVARLDESEGKDELMFRLAKLRQGIRRTLKCREFT